MKTRVISYASTIMLLILLSSGCLNQEIISSGNETAPTTTQPSPSSLIILSDQIEPNQTKFIITDKCNVTGPGDVFPMIRTEIIIRGKESPTEENIAFAVKEFGPDMKIPGYVPEGFFFRYVIIPDQYSEGRVTITFVNKSYNGPFVSSTAADQMDIVYSKNLDVEFAEFIDRESENVCINGRPGFFYNASPDRNIIRWLDGDIERWVGGYFDKDSLIRIASSMKTPSDSDLTSEVYSGNRTRVPDTFPTGMTIPATPRSI